jgi:hypothetical protein
MKISVNNLERQKNVLRPTSTIVRSTPIYVHPYEDENLTEKLNQNIPFSVDNKAKLQNVEENIAQNHLDNEPVEKRPIDFERQASLRIFEESIAKRKNILRPTQTIVKQLDSGVDIIDLGCGTFIIQPKSKGAPSASPSASLGHLTDCSWAEMHGFLGSEDWASPTKISHCNVEARPGYKSRAAHEYLDTEEVLSAKIRLLASLIVRSHNCLIYSGAGISTSSGINDYASKGLSAALVGDQGRPKIRSPYEAQPTLAHRVLVEMYKQNLIKYWIQQNHDGLPQKAGLPQHAINEVIEHR